MIWIGIARLLKKGMGVFIDCNLISSFEVAEEFRLLVGPLVSIYGLLNLSSAENATPQ